MQRGWTALIMAAKTGHTDCVRLLIDAGADKEAKDLVRVGRFVAGRASVRFISPFEIAPTMFIRFSSSLELYRRAARMDGADDGRYKGPHGLCAAADRCRGRQGGHRFGASRSLPCCKGIRSFHFSFS